MPGGGGSTANAGGGGGPIQGINTANTVQGGDDPGALFGSALSALKSGGATAPRPSGGSLPNTVINVPAYFGDVNVSQNTPIINNVPAYAAQQPVARVAGGWGSNSGGGAWNQAANPNYQPTYADKARALAQLEEQRANEAQAMGLGLQATLHRQNMLGGANAWNAWASMNPGFGTTPQIMNDAHDFMGFLSREPGIANSWDPRFLNWATQASGGIPRNSYTTLTGRLLSPGDYSDNSTGDYDPTDYSLREGWTPTSADYEAFARSYNDQARYLDPNRASAFDRPWYGDPNARYVPLDQLGSTTNDWVPAAASGSINGRTYADANPQMIGYRSGPGSPYYSSDLNANAHSAAWEDMLFGDSDGWVPYSGYQSPMSNQQMNDWLDAQFGGGGGAPGYTPVSNAGIMQGFSQALNNGYGGYVGAPNHFAGTDPVPSNFRPINQFQNGNYIDPFGSIIPKGTNLNYSNGFAPLIPEDPNFIYDQLYGDDPAAAANDAYYRQFMESWNNYQKNGMPGSYF